MRAVTSRAATERTALLDKGSMTSYPAGSSEAFVKADGEAKEPKQVGLQRHITLVDCVGIIIGNVIGSGIFISPKGVLENMVSPGATLITWAVMGLLALVQALCYAELGTMIPKAGGDYVYIYSILGPLPGFICAWTHIMIVASSANAVISRTAALYLGQAIGVNCHDSVITIIAVWIIVAFAIVNSISSKLGTRVQGLFSIAKVSALAVIIGAGIWNLANGYTFNFESPTVWEGEPYNLGYLGMGALDGYFAYKGWELVNTLPEEMVNPTRDLPISVVIAMLTCTSIYVLTNVAYLSIMTTSDMLSSDAVAMSFMKMTVGNGAAWFIAIAVALSCMGTINGSFLSDSRYLFAAGRNRQFPQLFAMIQIKFMTPLSGMIFLCLMSIAYSMIPHVETLQSYSALAVQLKVMLTIVALLVLRWKAPDLHRPVKVPLPLVMGSLLAMLTMMLLALWAEPVTIGLGVGLFLMGLPLYYLTRWLSSVGWVDAAMDGLTSFTQLLFEVILESVEDEGKQKDSS